MFSFAAPPFCKIASGEERKLLGISDTAAVQ
jgi:hypothetical protein